MSLRSLMKKNYLMQTKYLWKFSKSSVVPFCNLSPLGYVSCQQQSKDFLFNDVKLNLIRSKRFVSNQQIIEEKDLSKKLKFSIQIMNNDIKRKGLVFITDLEDAFNFIDNGAKLTPQIVLHLLRCLGEILNDEPLDKRRKIADKFWTKVKELQIDLNISHYNARLRCDIENDQEFDIDELFKTLKENNIEPNRITYQHIICKLGKMGKHEEAQKYLDIMKEKKMPINESIFGSLIESYIISGDMESADGILQIVKDTNLDLEHVVHSYISSMILSGKSTEDIESKINQFKAEEFNFEGKNGLKLLLNYVSIGNFEEANKILEKNLLENISIPDMRNIIPQLIFKGADEMAFKVFLTFNSLQSEKPLKKGVFFIRALLSQNSSIDKLMHYITLIEENINPKIALNSVRICLYQDKIDLAKELYQRCEKNIDVKGFDKIVWRVFNTITFNNLQEMKKTIDLFKEMDIPFDVNFLRNYFELKQFKNMQQIIDEFKEFKGYLVFSFYFHVALNYGLTKKFNINDLLNNMMAYCHIISAKMFAHQAAELFVEEKKDLFKVLIFINQIEHENKDKLFLKEIFRKISNKANKNQPNSGNKFIIEALKCLQNLNIAANKDLLDSLSYIKDQEVQDLLKTFKTGEDNKTFWTYSQKKIFINSFNTKSLKFNDKGFERISSDLSNDEALEKFENLLLSKQIHPSFEDIDRITTNFINDNRSKEIYSLLKKIVSNNSLIYASTFLKITKALYDDFSREEWEDHLVFAREYKDNLIGDWVESYLKEYSKNHKVEDSLKLLNEFEEKIGGVEENIDYLESKCKLSGLIYENRTDEAFELFIKEVEEKQRCTNKVNLMIHLAEKDELDKLQAVTDCVIKIIGETATIYKLIYSFLFCGKIRHAQKLAQTTGLKYREKDVRNICKMLIRKKDLKGLESFVSMTRSIKNFDRELLYDKLVDAYKQSDDDKLNFSQIEIFMEEENFIPSNKLKKKMSIN